MDEEAEAEAEEAERNALEADKRARDGIFVDDDSEVTDEAMIIGESRRQITPAVAPPPSTLSTWRTRKSNGSSAFNGIPPPSSAESIEEDDEYDGKDAGIDHDLTVGSGTMASPPGSASASSSSVTPWRRTGGKLPLSLASPPKSTPASASVMSPPASSAKTVILPSAASRLDGEGLAQLYANLSDEEKLNFVATIGTQATPSIAIAFLQKTSTDVQTHVKEWVELVM